MMDAIAHLKDFIAVLRRRIVLFVAIVMLCATAATLYALSLPRLYEAVSVIQMETSAVSDSLSTTADSSRTMQQLQRTEQQLMASTNLISVIQKFDLYSDLPGASIRQKIHLLRTATGISQVNNPSLQWRTGFSTDVPPTAIAVSVRLGDPRLVADVANEFAANVLDHSKKRRSDRTVAALKFFESEELRVGAEITVVEDKIAEFKRVNAELLPESISDKRYQIRNLEDAYLDLDRQLIELKKDDKNSQRSHVIKTITQIENQKTAIGEKLLGIKESIKGAPTVEKELSVLRRSLSQLEEQFTVITRHRAEAEMGRMLEISVQSDSFAILEVAKVPELPIAPDRRKIGVMGVAAGFILAAAIAYLLDNIQPVIRSAAQMESQLNIRPVVTIPYVSTVKSRLHQTFGRLAVAALLAVAIAAGLFMLDHFGLPILAIFNETFSVAGANG